MASGIVEPASSTSEDQQGDPAKLGQQSAPTTAITRTKLVQRLLDSSANLPTFVNDLVTAQAVMVAGTEAAGFLLERTDATKPQLFSLRPIAHIRPDESNQDTRNAALNAFKEIIKPCIEQSKDGAIEIQSSSDETIEPQFCLVTLLRNEGDIVAASAVVTRCRNLERAQQRLMSMQLVAGYFDLYSLRRTSDQSRVIAQSHQHVLQLATAVATAEGFESAGMNLCNELATRTGAVRVSLGWLKGHNLKVKALSHTEQFDKKQGLVVELENVMEECADQEEVVQFDPSGEATSPNVTRAAGALSRSQGNNQVLSVPMRRKDDIIGVVTLEFPPEKKLGPNVATGLAVAVELLAPQLYDRFQNDKWLIQKTGHSIVETTKLAIGPKHMIAKLVIVGIFALLAFVFGFSPMYHVSAPFQFATLEKRSVCAPYDGIVREVLVKPADVVTAGTPLLRLDTSELEIKKAEAMSEMRTHEREMDKYLADKKLAEYSMSEAERDKADAEVKYYDYLIRQGTIKAEIDGQVLTGTDLQEKQGAPVRQGDVLLEVGAADKLRAELAVRDGDIQLLHDDGKQTGTLATNSDPAKSYPLKIQRIVPLGDAKEGANLFKVIATLSDKPGERSAGWRPGMAGEARVDVGHRSLAWIWTHRFFDFLRLKLWM